MTAQRLSEIPVYVPQTEFSPSPSDKLSFFLSPPALPACCWICNSSPDGVRRFVDIGMSQDDYGAVYICSECWGPLCNGLGFVEIHKYESLQRDLAQAHAQLESMSDELATYRNLINSLNSVRPTLFAGDNPNLTVQEPTEDLLTVLRELTGTVGSAESTESEPAESDSSGGFEESSSDDSESDSGRSGLGL